MTNARLRFFARAEFLPKKSAAVKRINMENGERDDNGGRLARARDCNSGIVRKMGNLPALGLAQSDACEREYVLYREYLLTQRGRRG